VRLNGAAFRRHCAGPARLGNPHLEAGDRADRRAVVARVLQRECAGKIEVLTEYQLSVVLRLIAEAAFGQCAGGIKATWGPLGCRVRLRRNSQSGPHIKLSGLRAGPCNAGQVQERPEASIVHAAYGLNSSDNCTLNRYSR